MIGPNMFRSPINISSVLNSVKRILNIANKAIPLYKDAFPKIQKISNRFTNINKNNKNNEIELVTKKSKEYNNSLPVFFH